MTAFMILALCLYHVIGPRARAHVNRKRKKNIKKTATRKEGKS